MDVGLPVIPALGSVPRARWLASVVMLASSLVIIRSYLSKLGGAQSWKDTEVNIRTLHLVTHVLLYT